MSKRAAAEVCDDGHHVQVEEIKHCLDHGYISLPSFGGIVGLSKLSMGLSKKVAAHAHKLINNIFLSYDCMLLISSSFPHHGGHLFR